MLTLYSFALWWICILLANIVHFPIWCLNISEIKVDNLAPYWQEAGPCARGGRQGQSLILYDKFTLTLKTTDKDIAHIVKSKNGICIRKQIIDVFSDEDSNQEIFQVSYHCLRMYSSDFSVSFSLVFGLSRYDLGGTLILKKNIRTANENSN